MAEPMQPSRTYTLGILGISAQMMLALCAIVIWYIDPNESSEVLGLLGQLGLYAAGCSGAGAGAMSLRDYGSGGLTSSQGHQVLQSTTHASPFEPTP